MAQLTQDSLHQVWNMFCRKQKAKFKLKRKIMQSVCGMRNNIHSFCHEQKLALVYDLLTILKSKCFSEFFPYLKAHPKGSSLQAVMVKVDCYEQKELQRHLFPFHHLWQDFTGNLFLFLGLYYQLPQKPLHFHCRSHQSGHLLRVILEQLESIYHIFH